MWPPVSTNWMAECALERRRVGCFVLPVCGDGAPLPLAPSKELYKKIKKKKKEKGFHLKSIALHYYPSTVARNMPRTGRVARSGGCFGTFIT